MPDRLLYRMLWQIVSAFMYMYVIWLPIPFVQLGMHYITLPPSLAEKGMKDVSLPDQIPEELQQTIQQGIQKGSLLTDHQIESKH